MPLSVEKAKPKEVDIHFKYICYLWAKYLSFEVTISKNSALKLFLSVICNEIALFCYKYDNIEGHFLVYFR